MAVNFSDYMPTSGFNKPTRFEADVFDCEVSGEIPADLAGTFYRAVTDSLYPPKGPGDAGVFHADGYVGMFRFANGSCDYKGRYVRTPRYLANTRARRQLFGMYRNPSTDDPGVHGLNRTVANTAIYHHAGKLWALKEDSLPILIDPDTLETLGEWDFHGRYAAQTFTAHPKTDPRTGEMICWGYEATGNLSRDVFVYFVDRAGHVTREVRFQAPLVSMMHDVAVTERHIVFNTCGFVATPEMQREGKVHWAWDKAVPTYVGILPRDGQAKDLRWFRGPSSAAVHFLGGVTRGNKVIVDAAVSDGNPFPHFPQIDGSPWVREDAVTTTRRWTFDLASSADGWEEERLFPAIAGNLPRIDDRRITLDYRYGFVGYADPGRPFDGRFAGDARGRLVNSYARMDFATGEVKSYFVGEVGTLEEVQFVPRRADADEGDGYLIGVASNFAEMRSELVIVDAQRLEEIARVLLPFRLAPQVHGWWVAEGELGGEGSAAAIAARARGSAGSATRPTR